MSSRFEPTDLFRGAFIMCVGGDLEGHDRAYRNGDALVNPVQLRERMGPV